MVLLQIPLEKHFLSNSDPQCRLVDCSNCTEMVRFFLQPVVGRKSRTGKAGNTDGTCSLIFKSLLGKECGKVLGWPQWAQPGHTLETQTLGNVWDWLVGDPKARPHAYGWV